MHNVSIAIAIHRSMTGRNSVDQESDQEPDQCNELPPDYDDATREVITNAVNSYYL